jgi:hypothetical protein
MPYLLGERDEGQSVQVHVVAQLLGHGVVLVVLDAPPGAGHAAADAVQHDLQASVDVDVAYSKFIRTRFVRRMKKLRETSIMVLDR